MVFITWEKTIEGISGIYIVTLFKFTIEIFIRSKRLKSIKMKAILSNGII